MELFHLFFAKGFLGISGLDRRPKFRSCDILLSKCRIQSIVEFVIEPRAYGILVDHSIKRRIGSQYTPELEHQDFKRKIARVAWLGEDHSMPDQCGIEIGLED
ncbi:MAG: hypothetical protein CMN73_15660 [Sphingomonas sp.]|nr:hypothetical protein [Sphingomonas sp.]